MNASTLRDRFIAIVKEHTPKLLGAFLAGFAVSAAATIDGSGE